jgi:hypothetical protein
VLAAYSLDTGANVTHVAHSHSRSAPVGTVAVHSTVTADGGDAADLPEPT